ncbi:hypothetical protein HB770_20750 [Rhizobium leguminosarum bv. viciae]|uniref:Transmembrane protein n=1 Tax=Rhizobium leguminosarum bv. viciae TaxID=387 RepID=A0A7G6RL10_RHILV|nr:hypothetical protein HB770_20750 [Rhizobium leguminosarum bv. viciae]
MNDTKVTEMPVKFEVGRLNIWNLLWFFMGVLVQVAIGAAIWTNLNRDVAEIRQAQRDGRIISEKNTEELKAQVAPVPQMKFLQDQQAGQIVELKTQVVDMNKRFDRMIELLGGKMDGMSESLNSLRTDVKVLAQEVRNNSSDKAQKTMMTR